jgi:class 3 adenylate cyclase
MREIVNGIFYVVRAGCPRVGIATGLVVIGELIGKGAAEERVAIGETVNLAARMQAVASPDSIVVGELTRQLAGAAFDYEDLGLRELKGIPGELRRPTPGVSLRDLLRRKRVADACPASAPGKVHCGRGWRPFVLLQK